MRNSEGRNCKGNIIILISDSINFFLLLLKAVHASLLNSVWQNKYVKATLHGAIRREKLAEREVRSLKAEIEHLNRLVNSIFHSYIFYWRIYVLIL